MKMTKICQSIIESAKLILPWKIWLKFVKIVNPVKLILLQQIWLKFNKIIKSMNIHLV